MSNSIENKSEDRSRFEDESEAFFHCDALEQSGWTPLDKIRLPIDDLGFRQGVTAVERLRSYQGKPFLVAQHELRFRQTLKLLRINLDHVSWSEQTSQLLDRNRSWIARRREVGITWWATPGNTSSPCSPTYALHLNELDLIDQQRKCELGQDVICTSVQQPSERSWSRQAKTRCRLHYYLADQEASRASPGAMGLLRDVDGSLTESSIANFAIVRHGEIHSPPPEKVLEGVTQQHVQSLAKKLGVRWLYRPLFDSDLFDAECILLMGTDAGLWFASSVDGKRINPPGQSDLVRRMQRDFS